MRRSPLVPSLAAIALLSPIGLSGCEDSPGPTGEKVEAAGDSTDAGTAGDATDSFVAKPVSYEEFQAILAGADGPVLVDCWAEWCKPCRKGFPHTVALAEKHADDGLTVVSLAFNDATEQAEVDEFLTSVNADAVINLRTDDGGGDGTAWDALRVIGLPTLLLYNAAGEEVARLGGSEDLEAEVDAAVADVLGG
ncbi:MAG: TlpA disulfide reductase family protein [Planctomycetota bacterium]